MLKPLKFSRWPETFSGLMLGILNQTRNLETSRRTPLVYMYDASLISNCISYKRATWGRERKENMFVCPFERNLCNFYDFMEKGCATMAGIKQLLMWQVPHLCCNYNGSIGMVHRMDFRNNSLIDSLALRTLLLLLV